MLSGAEIPIRVAFTADDCEFDAAEYAVVCSVWGGEHGLTFQRDAESSPDDWGIHLEYGGQANGDYGCIAACRIGPESLSVDLGKQLGKLEGVTGFDVSFQLSEDQLATVRDGLRQVFRDQLQLLADA